MRKVIILNYETGIVHIINVSQETEIDEEEIVEFCREINISSSSIEWMVVSELKIEYHDIL